MALEDEGAPSNLLNFVVLRAPAALGQAVSRRNFIHDETMLIVGKEKRELRAIEFAHPACPSEIGKLVYRFVFCDPDPRIADMNAGTANIDRTGFRYLLPLILPFAEKRYVACSTDDAVEGAAPVQLSELEQHAYLTENSSYYILPDTLDRLEIEWATQLQQLDRILFDPDHAAGPRALVTAVKKQFNVDNVYEIVFSETAFSAPYVQAKRALFDALYLLYLLRRVVNANMEPIVRGLQSLHLLEALAIDGLVANIRASAHLAGNTKSLVDSLAKAYPALMDWDGKFRPSGMPLIRSREDIVTYLTAPPIIHPIFPRLLQYPEPQPNLKPIGVGDLKVVKTWLSGYRAGDISYIDNVLVGETKVRVHRRLEKSEETFSFSREQQEESTKDTQSTQRFDFHREVDNVVQATLALDANASMTYKGAAITATGSLGFSYNRAQTDTTKISSNYWQETVSKAVQRIQSSVSEQRSFKQQFETEETNTHTLANPGGPKHISGIYRWVDKIYKAQLYNFGKRTMFEFIIPEPSAFLVASRLRAFEATIVMPEMPVLKLKTLERPAGLAGPEDISEAKFNELRVKYDLDDMTFPPAVREVMLVDTASNQGFFAKEGLPNGSYDAETYSSKLDSVDWVVKGVWIEGLLEFQGPNEAANDPKNKNQMVLFIEGTQFCRDEGEVAQGWPWQPKYFEGPNNADGGVILHRDTIALTIGIWDGNFYRVTIRALLHRTDKLLNDFRTAVYTRIAHVEQKKVDDENRELQLAYDAMLSVYKTRLDELRTKAVMDLLRGKSEALNKQTILTELKRLTIETIVKSFGDGEFYNALSESDALGSEVADFRYYMPKVTEGDTGATFEYERVETTTPYPIEVRDKTKNKGRYVQFLEQAFEWEQLAYLFYPYFWAARPKWIENMNRLDESDPHFSAFLQAGSARVLLAVTRPYEDAVTHFLATGEPWNGGPAPVIGDPLFIPLYEEMRKAQDDLEGAVPEGPIRSFRVPTALVYLQDSSSDLPGPKPEDPI